MKDDSAHKIFKDLLVVDSKFTSDRASKLIGKGIADKDNISRGSLTKSETKLLQSESFDFDDNNTSADDNLESGFRAISQESFVPVNFNDDDSYDVDERKSICQPKSEESCEAESEAKNSPNIVHTTQLLQSHYSHSSFFVKRRRIFSNSELKMPEWHQL